MLLLPEMHIYSKYCIIAQIQASQKLFFVYPNPPRISELSECLQRGSDKRGSSVSLKELQIANFSQINHSPTFGRAFTW